jgi:glucose/mannose-6-phosphate isomerase
VRWKTQFNENAKVPAFWGVIPEVDHNEIEGWADYAGGRFAAVVLRYPGEHSRIAARVSATGQVLSGSGLEIRQVQTDAAGSLAALLSLILVGDFTTTYAAILRGVDPAPVPTLTALKERLRG